MSTAEGAEDEAGMMREQRARVATLIADVTTRLNRAPRGFWHAVLLSDSDIAACHQLLREAEVLARG